MATETQKPNATRAENSKKTIDTPSTNSLSTVQSQHDTSAVLSSASKQLPLSDGAGADTANPDDSTSKGMNGGEVVKPALPADIQKKVKRAERFGVPVLLSEEEKRNSRAERFGSGSRIDASKAEEQKRKARAERFGLAAQSAVDEDAKKKARLERFSPVTKVDPQEEEKRKARALRFTQCRTVSNGKGSADSNTSGKAGGEA